MKYVSILLFLTIYSVNTVIADNPVQNSNRPKVGLVLSGGGAKGLVYIPLLKVIDSLGLHIDYLTGTSMGALIGGLYSIGYTGKELDSIARNINWDKYLSDDLPMSQVNMEEKDEYGRYLLELKSNQIMPSLPMGLIEGQNIMKLLNALTFKVMHIQDFSQFKIPFKCYAADIINGVPVEMKSGSLALALRASMSIPTVFSPIDTNGMLLVDGGILKNFPVEEIKEMGADFIIGANSSGYSLKKKDLRTLLKVFEQMLNVTGTEDYQKQKDLCDLLIDYAQALNAEGYGSSDFNSTVAILDLGERVVKNFIPILSEIAQQQKAFIDDSILNTNWRAENEREYSDYGVRIQADNYQSLIKNKIEFADTNHVTQYEINRAVDRIYGTRFFDRVYYYTNAVKDTTPYIVFKAEGAKKFTYKFGLHYDPELSAGATLNFTYRKVGKYTSRTTLSFDLSDNPKIRIGYQLYFGNSGWWLSTNHFFSSIDQDFYESRKNLREFNHIYSSNNLAFNWTIGQNNLISIGTEFEFQNRKNRQTIEEKFFTNDILLVKTPYYNYNFFLKLVRNTLDRPIFPSKGIYVLGSLKYVAWGNGKIKYYAPVQDTSSQNVSYEREVQYPEFSAYAKLHLQYEQYITLAEKFMLHYRGDAGFMFVSHGLSGRSFIFPRQDAFFAGGVESRERERLDTYIPFWGNKEGFSQAFNFLSLMIEGQIMPVKNLYLLPRWSIITYDDGKEQVYGSERLFIDKWKGNMEWAWSAGLGAAYNSKFGPIKASISKASNANRWIFYASYGYRF